MPEKLVVTGCLMLGLLFCGSVLPARAQQPRAPVKLPPPVDVLDLSSLEAIALRSHPALLRQQQAVAVARGLAQQAKAYPNPNVGFVFDELGDVQGPSGVNSLPGIVQPIVMPGKRRASYAAAVRLINQQTWDLLAERYRLLGAVREKYVTLLALETRLEQLRAMETSGEELRGQAERLRQAKQISRLPLVELEIELIKVRSRKQAAEAQLLPLRQALAATAGVPSLELAHLSGKLGDDLPAYDMAEVQATVLACHPRLMAARNAAERARLLLERAQLEPYPDLSVETAYIRQNQNRSDDYRLGASMNVPLWDRNQGNIRAARAAYAQARAEVRVREVELATQAGDLVQQYAGAREVAVGYRWELVPRTEEALRLMRLAFEAGEVPLEAVWATRRAAWQARLDLIDALEQAWQAAALLSELCLEDAWRLPAISERPSAGGLPIGSPSPGEAAAVESIPPPARPSPAERQIQPRMAMRTPVLAPTRQK